MAKRFVIVTDSVTTTREARNAITHFLESKQWQLWHWIEDAWIIADVPDRVTPSEIQREISSEFAGMFVVIEVTPYLAGTIPSRSIEWMVKNFPVARTGETVRSD